MGGAARKRRSRSPPTSRGCDLAVIVDSGDEQDIHPRNKALVGRRLSRIALARDYGARIEHSGPRLVQASYAGGGVTLRFSHCQGGLACLRRDADPRLRHRWGGSEVRVGRGQADGRHRDRQQRPGHEPGRRALWLGRLPGRQPGQPGRPAGATVSHRHLARGDQRQALRTPGGPSATTAGPQSISRTSVTAIRGRERAAHLVRRDPCSR